MNILFLADPNSIHDVKWINYFVDRKMVNAYLLVRDRHWSTYDQRSRVIHATTLASVADFSIARFYRTIATAFRIRRIIKKYKIDLINLHYAEPNALWCVFRKYFRVPMIITTLGTDVLVTIPNAFSSKSFINYLVAPAYKLAFNQADRITSTSRGQMESVKRISGRDHGLAIIRTGVDMDRIQSDTSPYFPLSNNRPFVLFPRFIKPIYNHEFALAAISLLPADIKRYFKMVFVGKNHGDESYQHRIEQLMSEQSDVTFEFIEKQDQEGVFELYKRASAVVMTPLSDGSPVSGMEALVCGSRLILGPLDYDPDLFSDAIKLSHWDPVELKHAIVDVLSNSGPVPELTVERRRVMDRKYNMDTMMKIYKDVCDEIDR